MSRPRNYWYGIVKKMIFRYSKLEDDSEQERKYKEAIEEALLEIESLPHGDMRQLAVDEVFFRKIKTCEGVALEINYSHNTVQSWLNDFVKRVGEKAGYKRN